MTTTEQIEKAEKLIGLVLAQLERETGGYVNNVSVRDIDVTQLVGIHQQIRRRAVIDLKPKPGTNWSV